MSPEPKARNQRQGRPLAPYVWHEGWSKLLPLTDRVLFALKKRLRDAVSSPPKQGSGETAPHRDSGMCLNGCTCAS